MTDLAGDTCCILSLGRIGEAVAERASAFEMVVHGIKRETDGYDGSADVVYPPGELSDALSGPVFWFSPSRLRKQRAG